MCTPAYARTTAGFPSCPTFARILRCGPARVTPRCVPAFAFPLPPLSVVVLVPMPCFFPPRIWLLSSAALLASAALLGRVIINCVCSAIALMSALPPIADMCSALADVRFVPLADITTGTSPFPCQRRSARRKQISRPGGSDLAALFWPPISCQPLRLGDLIWGHLACHQVAIGSGSAATEVRCRKNRAAARLNQTYAMTLSGSPTSPLAYESPRLYCAGASPWSAARRY